MRFIFKFPDIGEGIAEGKILEWLVRAGQEVAEGDPLVKMETDKVVADLPAPRAGKVVQLYGKVGEIARVDEGLVELEIEGQEPPEPPSEKVEEKGFGVVGEIEVAHEGAFLPATGEGLEAPAAVSSAAPRRKALATPVARAMARELGLEIDAIAGSGPGGRVMKADIEQAFARQGTPEPAPVAAPAPGEEVSYEELSQLRKSIAARMARSKFTAPHLTCMEKIEAGALVELRERKRADFLAQSGLKLTYLPFIVQAACAALREFPVLNGRLELENNRFARQHFHHIGVAVDSPDGLVVPVIRHADRKSIRALAAEIADLAARARERRLSLEEIRGGTFTITNWGAIAGTYGAPIINYPEVAILGVGRIADEPVVRAGAVVPGKTMALSLSADHRIVDGADAARFLKRVGDLLTDPLNLLLS